MVKREAAELSGQSFCWQVQHVAAKSDTNRTNGEIKHLKIRDTTLPSFRFLVLHFCVPPVCQDSRYHAEDLIFVLVNIWQQFESNTWAYI